MSTPKCASTPKSAKIKNKPKRVYNTLQTESSSPTVNPV